MIDDVPAAVTFYTTLPGFTLEQGLRTAGVAFRTNEIVTGPGGSQVVIDDPSGNPVELFQPRK